VTEVLEELGCAGHRTLVLLNKIDAADDEAAIQVLRHNLPDSLAVSARTGAGLPDLVERVRELVAGPPRRVRVQLSVADGRAIAFLEQHAEVLDRRYHDRMVEMEVVLGTAILSRLQENHPSSKVLQCA
jgi:GTP-binding protein HflX